MPWYKVPAKFRENTAMRFQVTVRKLNVTDRWTDGRTDWNDFWGEFFSDFQAAALKWL